MSSAVLACQINVIRLGYHGFICLTKHLQILVPQEATEEGEGCFLCCVVFHSLDFDRFSEFVLL